ncbi:MAG TPA: DUF4097 family beta strand repeat-containing protein [Candidatus Limnocylindrales bacterium]|nr:DUF4097 family beta strand repeat-containing protein [Candidatus Limnocylindrales bacterium]
MNRNQHMFLPTILFTVVLGCSGFGQGAPDGRVVAKIADPSRPASVSVHIIQGNITVQGGNAQDVTVEARLRDDHEERRSDRNAAGMKRIPMTSSGLNVEAENNQVRITTDQTQRTVDLTITVPVRSSLSLKTINDGNIVVTGVDGELDVNDINGNVTLKNVSGSVVAHALNGNVVVTMNRADAKPMAFSSLNGNIDVTFPADLKATVSMRTDNGEVYSDFDVQLDTTAPRQIVEDGRSSGGKYRVRMDKTVRGKIGGGGPEIQFKNFNGNIYIRKAGAK